MRLRVLGSLALLATGMWAQPVPAPVPPAPAATAEVPMADEKPAVVPGSAWVGHAAFAALREGYPQLAAALFRQGKAQGESGDAWLLGWATALLATGDAEGARSQLQMLDEPTLPPARLRLGLLAALEGRWADARTALNGLTTAELPAADIPWLHLAQAWLADEAGEEDATRAAYQEAAASAPTPGLAAQFELMRQAADLRRQNAASEADLERLRQTQRQMAGSRAAFEAGRLRALTLSRLQRNAEAVQVVEELLRTPGLDDYGLRAPLLLLTALVSGEESGRARLALRELVSLPQAPRDLQEVAVQLLAQQALQASDPAEFRQALQRWLEQTPAHPLADRLLLVRAQLAQTRGDLDAAERDARAVLERYPDSKLVEPALSLLAQVNWRREPARYRTAADYLQRLRQRLPAGADRARLGVLIGDSYFLNGDYSNAAEAYGNALREAGLTETGPVLYQKVLAELRARRPDAAVETLDGAGPETLGLEARWRAEWNLIDTWRRAGETAKARQRLQGLLAKPPAAQLELALRLRLRWLALRLALDAGDGAEVPPACKAVLDELATDKSLPAAERTRLDGYFRLLLGEAYYQLGQSEQATAVFEELRRIAPNSGPAILTYLVSAREGAVQNRLVQAQQNLIDLADLYPKSEYAPLALWEAALYAERRGLDSTYQEAIGILERLAQAYPEHPLLFYVRLKQADLSRKLNDFGTALLLYERARNQFPQHPERFRAEMARADVLLAAGSAQQPERLAAAALEFERLADLPNAPLDLRLEASFKWGRALQLQGERDRSQATYLASVDRFWTSAEAGQLGLQGRYWLSRLLLELGASLEQTNRPDQAIQTYRRLIDRGLPGESLARQRITRLLPPG